MRRVKFLVAAILQLFLCGLVSGAQQQVQLSDSYLPVAMQVIAHLTDQMAFETKDEPSTAKPTKPTNKPVYDWQKPQKPTTNPWPKPTTSSWQKPTSKPTVKPPYSWPPYSTAPTNSWSSWTTSRPYVSLADDGFYTPASGNYPFGKPAAIGKPPAFWKPPTFGNPPAFGKPSTFGNPPDFWKPPTSENPPAIGKPPAFGKPPTFGNPPAFGKPPTFGNPPAFGKPPTFGNPPAFGKPPTFGNPSAFGKPPTFGNPPAFGKPPTFGNPPAFGKPPTFGNPPAFGNPPPFSTASWTKPPTSSTYLTPSENGPVFKPPFNSPAGTFPYLSFGSNVPSGPKPPLGMQPTSGWWMNYGLAVRDATTLFHRPGFYAPAPPKPHERFRVMPKSGYLLPYDDSQYTVIGPQETRSDTLLDVQGEEEVQPLVEPAKDPQLLPHFEEEENEKAPRVSDEINEENLQYLSQSVQEMIRMANDPDDDRVVDVWDDIRGANNQEILPKGKLSASNLRLLLLYDLLSREAKRLRLSDYSENLLQAPLAAEYFFRSLNPDQILKTPRHIAENIGTIFFHCQQGFSPDVLKSVSESSSGGARQQLAFALSRMVERKDCEHEYANNRAREMVQELAKDGSTMSSEIRYLQPLIYKF